MNLKLKRLIEDLETGSVHILAAVKTATKATSAGYAGTTYYATSAGGGGTSGTAGTA